MDKVSRYLITTSDERTWKFDRPVIFLGEWCRLFDRRHIWEKMDAIVAVPYGLGQQKKEFDHNITRELTDNLFKILCNSLNQHHGLSYGDRFWKIVLGHWLYRYVDVIFNRVKTLEQCLQEHTISGTSVFANHNYYLATQDTHTAIWAFNDDIWNNVLISRILQYLEGVNFPIEIIANPSPSTSYVYRKISIPSKRKAISKYVYDRARKILGYLARDEDAFIINSYLPRIAEIKLQLALGQFPQFWSSPTVSLLDKVNKCLRVHLTCRFVGNSEDGLENILNIMFFELLPVCYLEGFDNLLDTVSQVPWPENPKYIFTSSNFDVDEVFKVWAAQKIEKGSKYYIGQHGNYGAQQNNDNPSNEEITADKFLTWGWTDGLSQHAPAFIFRILGDKAEDYDRQGGLLLIELHSGHRLSTWDNIAEFGDYFEYQKRFILKLLPLPKENLTVRLHSAYVDLKWNEMSRWKEFDSSIYINSSGDIKKLIARSRLVIHGYDSTGMLETLSKNIPTLAFWPNCYDNLRPTAKPFYDLLVDVGIVHLSPESVAQKVNEVWSDVDGWWRQDFLQEARVKFCERYAKQTSRPIRTLIRMLK